MKRAMLSRYFRGTELSCCVYGAQTGTSHHLLHVNAESVGHIEFTNNTEVY
jgi:hypothetical protein